MDSSEVEDVENIDEEDNEEDFEGAADRRRATSASSVNTDGLEDDIDTANADIPDLAHDKVTGIKDNGIQGSANAPAAEECCALQAIGNESEAVAEEGVEDQPPEIVEGSMGVHLATKRRDDAEKIAIAEDAVGTEVVSSQEAAEAVAVSSEDFQGKAAAAAGEIRQVDANESVVEVAIDLPDGGSADEGTYPSIGMGASCMGEAPPQDGSLADASGISNGPGHSGSDVGVDEVEQTDAAADRESFHDAQSGGSHCIPRTELLTIRTVVPLSPPQKASLRTEHANIIDSKATLLASAASAADGGAALAAPPGLEDVAAGQLPGRVDCEGRDVKLPELPSGVPPPAFLAPLPAAHEEDAAAGLPSAIACTEWDTEPPSQSADPPPPAFLEPLPAAREDTMCDPGTDARKADTDPATRELIQELQQLFQKRAHAASEAVLREFKEKWAACSDTGLAAVRTVDGQPEVLRSILAEARQLAEQVSKNDQAAASALMEASRSSTGSLQLQKAVAKELASWRDSSLSKAVLKAVDGKVFADRLADGLRSSSSETAPLLEALQVSRAQLKEMLRADLHEWCTTVAERKGLVGDGELSQAKGALDAAMRELRVQARRALDSRLDELRRLSSASRLSQTCSDDVTAAVRGEVQRWQQSLPPRGPAGLQGERLRQRFASRLRLAVAPIEAELGAMSQAMEEANSTLAECGAPGVACEASSSSARRGADLVSARASTLTSALTSAAAGRLKEAFERALAWDCSNGGRATTTEGASLTELVCDHLQQAAPAAAAEPLAPEDILSRPAAAGMGAPLKLRMAGVLIQRAASDVSQFPRIEANLEWVGSLLQSAAEGECAGIGSSLEAVRPQAVRALEELRQAERPRALAEAPTEERRRVVLQARMALKSLDMLARLGRDS